jgi:hypothetical protein
MSESFFCSPFPQRPAMAQDIEIDCALDTEFKWNGMQYRVTKQSNGKYRVEGKGPNNSWTLTTNPDVQAEAKKALGL